MYNAQGQLISQTEVFSNIRKSTQDLIFGEKQVALEDPIPLLNLLEQLGDNQRVLVVRNGGLGDALCITPLLRYLSSKLGLCVDVRTSENYVCLFENNPHVTDIYTLDSIIEEEMYDAIIDLNNYVEDAHHLTQHRPRAFAKACGLDIKDDISLDYFSSAKELKWAEQLLCNQPFMSTTPIGYVWDSSTQNRNLSITEHKRILDYITRQLKLPIVIFSASHVDLPIDSLRIFNVTGKLSIRETAALMSYCKPVITPDTGLFHTASALNLKVLTYFGAFPLQERISHNKVHLINTQKCPYIPCRSYSCICENNEECSPCLEIDLNKVLLGVA